MKEVIKIAVRHTAKMIYVPKKLRKYVEVETTSAGTRLKSK